MQLEKKVYLYVSLQSETTEEGAEKKDDEKAPIGNGGRTDNYIWTQTLEEV